MVKIPVTRSFEGQTARPTLAYARPGQALDISPITDAIKGFADEIKLERKKLDKFELNKKLIEETTELQKDFEQRKLQAPLGAADFTDQIAADYETRHKRLLDKYWQEGYDEDELAEFDMRLTGVRENFNERALGFQADSFAQLGKKSFTEMATKLSQYTADNPDGYEAAKTELTNNAELIPGWTAQQKDEALQSGLAVIRQGAARGLATKNPRYVLQMLDPKGYTASRGGGITVAGSVSGFQGVALNVASQLGLKPEEVAAVMSFETGGDFDPNKFGGDGGKYLGLIQFSEDNQRKYGIKPNSTPEEWTAAIVQYMKDRGFETGMGIENFYAAVLRGQANLVDDVADSNGTTVRNAIPRILSDHADNARKWLAKGTSQSVTIAAGSGQPEPTIGADGANDLVQIGPNLVMNGSLGNPLLDDMTGFERWQLLSYAREQENKVSGAAKAAMDLEIGNAVSEFMSAGTGRKLTKDQVIAAYGPGLEAEQKWAQYERASMAGPTLQRIRTLPADQMAVEIEKLKPVVGSPTYELDLKFYTAAQQAQQELLKQRSDDPAKSIFTSFPELAQRLTSARTTEDRRGAFAEMKRRYEQLGIPERERTYATDEMVASMTSQYAAAAPAMKLSIIEQYLNELPDATAAGHAMGAFGGHKIAQDIALWSTLRLLPGYQNTFMRVMAGKQLIDVDPARKPNPAAINKAFAGQLGETLNVLSAEVSVMYNEAAAALYVEAGGRTEGGDILDPDLYTKSLNEAMGTSGIVDLNGGKVKELTILPRGVTQTDFENWKDNLRSDSFLGISVSRGQPSDKSNRPLTASDIASEGVFVMRSPGVYGIKMMSDGAWVGNGQGRPYTIRLDAGTIKRKSTGRGVYAGTVQ